MCARDSEVTWCIQEFQALKNSSCLVTTCQIMERISMNNIWRKANLQISFFFCWLVLGGCVVSEREGSAEASHILAKHSTMD